MIKFVTEGGIRGKHNIYYDNWTYEINSSKDVEGHDIIDFEAVNRAYIAEHPTEGEVIN